MAVAPSPRRRRYLSSDSDLTALEAWLANRATGILALRVEATGRDVRAANFEVRHIGFGASDGTAWVLDATDRAIARQALSLAVHTQRKVWAHDATFEALALHHGLDFRFASLNCSRTLTVALDPELAHMEEQELARRRPAVARALGELAERWARLRGGHLGPAAEWLPQAVAALPADDSCLLRYVAATAVECARLVHAFQDTTPRVRLRQSRRETRVEDLWRWVSDRGYRLDHARVASELSAVARAKAEAVERYGVDITSDGQATREWVRTLGIRITDGAGRPTLSNDHWERAYVPAKARSAWGDFTRLRQLSSTASKISEISRSIAGSPTGRLHPRIRAVGTRTGRTTVSKPALQNIGALSVVLVADEGMSLVSCDLDRVEPRVAAALSQDAALIEAVEADVYVELAVAVWGESARHDKTRRATGKRAFLATLYGQGARSLALELGIDRREASEILEGIRRSYPGLARWVRRVQSDAKSGVPLLTRYGRPLPEGTRESHKAVNWCVQGTAADLFKECTIRVADELGPEVLWMPVHDELIIQVPHAQAPEAAGVLGDAMSTELDGVPITGTPKILGERWWADKA